MFAVQVTVKTTLGPAATPLSVYVSLEIPRLLLGPSSDSPCPSPLGTETKTEADDDQDTTAAPAAAEAEAAAGVGVENDFRSRYGNGLPLRFPPTQVGEWREVFVEVANPADVPVRVQLASAVGEPAVWTERRQASEAVVPEGVGADVTVALETASTSLPAATAGTAGGLVVTPLARKREPGLGSSRSPSRAAERRRPQRQEKQHRGHSMSAWAASRPRCWPPAAGPS